MWYIYDNDIIEGYEHIDDINKIYKRNLNKDQMEKLIQHWREKKYSFIIWEEKNG